MRGCGGRVVHGSLSFPFPSLQLGIEVTSINEINSDRFHLFVVVAKETISLASMHPAGLSYFLLSSKRGIIVERGKKKE